ncbi:Autoinducer 2 sensor kinase/phosphatase LuxQ [Pseudodesulfovibrio profundus]|uniref:histidine kinase n=1 Tax=Pseudodesulfovibrio profundus TaxID=57320 RepID=A0A2C8FF32_9BACT|nr:HAMP domain-containing sensor histidine kinase [Pseudodesulfovibrio profundus]SOB60670.1 Autoinducer 2 sensor kinase/phosphatase LuxQ [Pseudodesulfovibrio profundus]
MRRVLQFELILYALILVGGFSLLSSMDGFERFHDFSRTHEDLELDEAALILPIALICLAIYSYRRKREVFQKNKAIEDARNELQEAYDRIHDLTKSKEEFMAIACHELKGPLGGAMSALKLVSKDACDSHAYEMVDLARESMNNLQLLINDVLLFSSLSQQQEIVRSAPFSLRKVVTSIERITRVTAESRGLELSVSVDDDVPERLVGHEGWLRLICLNILGNAIKFTEAGRVTFTCSYQNSPDSRLVISIGDTGPGIPLENQEMIFEPYEQVETSRWKRSKGVGLGLAVVKKIVELLNGTIYLHSSPGKGSIFTITLPVESID